MRLRSVVLLSLLAGCDGEGTAPPTDGTSTAPPAAPAEGAHAAAKADQAPDAAKEPAKKSWFQEKYGKKDAEKKED